jgi:DNA-binding transcriptional ArsR family regulator
MELLLWGPGAATSIGSSVADVYGISVGSASRHLAILANAGLVDVTVDSNYRWHSLAVPIAPEVPAWLGAMAGELWDPRDRV